MALSSSRRRLHPSLQISVPEWKLTARMGANSQQERPISGQWRSILAPGWKWAGLIWWSKFKDLSSNQWMANGQYVTWITANETSQWATRRPWPSSHPGAACECWLCFRVKNQSYYPPEGKGYLLPLWWFNSSSWGLLTFWKLHLTLLRVNMLTCRLIIWFTLRFSCSNVF